MTASIILAVSLATQFGPGECIVRQPTGDVKAWFEVIHEGQTKRVWGCMLSNGHIRWWPHEQPAEPAPAPAPAPVASDETEFPPRLWDGSPEDWARRHRAPNYGLDIDKMDPSHTIRASDPATLREVQKVVDEAKKPQNPFNPFKRVDDAVTTAATTAVAACLFLGGLVLLTRRSQ